MTTSQTIKAIKADYQPVLDSLNQEKQELLQQRQELLQAQSTLLKHGLDDFDVYYKIREIEEKVNRVIDDEQTILTDIKNQVNFIKKLDRQNKEQEAFNAGRDAYNKSMQDGTYHSVCSYKSQNLQRHWKKGYDFMCEMHGALGGISYVA